MLPNALFTAHQRTHAGRGIRTAKDCKQTNIRCPAIKQVYDGASKAI